MSDSDDEKGVNPYFDYMEYTAQPWVYFERQKKYKLYRKGISSYCKQAGSPFASTNNYDVTEERQPSVIAFQPRNVKDMLADFFVSGKPKLTFLGKHADQFIIWSVCQGRYRANSNKSVWVYQGADGDILKLKHGESALWRKVDETVGFGIIREIAEMCDRLYAEILHRFARYSSSSKYYKCCLENYRNLPEFAQFQTHRTPDHKKMVWIHQGRSQGGKKKDMKPEKPIANKVQSIHRALLNYHTWLPEF